MKRTIAHLLLVVCVAGLVRADQTTQSVQQALKEQGFYYGNVTGGKSAETTAAIRRYQIRNGLQVTGDIDPETLRSLDVNSKSASSSQPISKSAVTQSNNARPAETPPIDQNSLPQPPSAADRQPDTNPTFPGAPYQSAPRRISKRIVIGEVQRQLMSRGYYRGSIDGRYGRRTAFALGAFQLQSGLPPTSRLDMPTLNALGLSNANMTYAQSPPRQYENWVPITKFKHGKWKVKWKKLHRGENDEYGDNDLGKNRDAWWDAEDHDE